MKAEYQLIVEKYDSTKMVILTLQAIDDKTALSMLDEFLEKHIFESSSKKAYFFRLEKRGKKTLITSFT